MNTKTTVISQAELDAQFACCDKIAAYWQTKGRTPTAYVETYGCQQNEADSEKLRGFLAQCGYAIVGSAEGADVVIMNTCAIREHAEQRVFGNLGAPALGVRGAALATLIARSAELVIVVVHLLTTKFFRVQPALVLLPGLDMVKRFVRYGGPVVCNETLWGLGTSMFATVMGHMEGSTEILAAYTIAGNVEKICMVFSFGIAATAAIIIGREIGAGRTDQVYNTGLTLNTLAALCGACLGVLLWLFARFVAPVWVFPLFHLSEGAESVATMMITVMALYMTLKDFNSVNIVGVLRGGGDVRAATLIDIGPLWTCAIPYAAICGLVLRLPVLWVYLAFPLEQVIKCSMGISRLRSGKWVRDVTAVHPLAKALD